MRISIPAALCILSLAAPAAAEVTAADFNVTPFAGVRLFEKGEPIRNNLATGIRGGFELNERWSLEAFFKHVPLKSTEDDEKGNLFTFGGELLYHFNPTGKVVPFLAVGESIEKTSGFNGNNLAPALTVGGGLKYYLSDKLALRGDLREVFTFYRKEAGSESVTATQNLEATVGLTYHFGAPKRRPATETQPVSAVPAVPARQAQAAPQPPSAPASVPPSTSADATAAAGTGAPFDGVTGITGFRVEQNALELVASRPITDYRVLTLSQPSRLLIDIPNAVSGLKVETIPAHRFGVANVRFENHPDFLRVILDAEQADVLPYRIEEKGNVLRVIITNPVRKG